MKKLTPAQKEAFRPAHLPRHYYPGYAFIPKNGYFQARKIGLQAERVKTDPRFHNTRLIASEFQQVSIDAKLLHQLFCTPLQIKLNRHRLIGTLLKMLQADTHNPPGSRTWVNGDLSLLEGFEFNTHTPLQNTLLLDYDIELRPENTSFQLHLPSFVPACYIKDPPGVDYARIVLMGLTLNLDEKSYNLEMDQTNRFPVKKIHFPGTTLTVNCQEQNQFLTIIALGIQWYPQSQPASLAVIAVF